MENKSNIPIVSIIMGSQSDWLIMKETHQLLTDLEINHENKIISAHRTPVRMHEYAVNAHKRGIKIIIAGAGGSAHLPGMISSHSELPVIGVPIDSTSLNGMDSLLSIVQMPKGIPVATMSIGIAGAKNAAVFAAEILSLSDTKIKNKLLIWKANLTNSIDKIPK